MRTKSGAGDLQQVSVALAISPAFLTRWHHLSTLVKKNQTNKRQKPKLQCLQNEHISVTGETV